jgi:hypothetical protein
VHELIEMTHDECETILRAGLIGRMGLSTPTGPHIIPVNYSVIDDAIVVRTDPAGVLGTWAQHAPLVFQVDHFDHEWQWGWSISARGVGRWVTLEDEIRHIESEWPPRPWAAGDRSRWLSLAWTEITGRKLGSGWNAVASMPARRMP